MTTLNGLRVLQVLPTLAACGVARDAVEVAVALARAGAASTVASAGGPLQRELDRAGVAHLILPSLASHAPWSAPLNAYHLAKIVQARGVNVLHAHSRLLAWAGWWTAQRHNVRLVTTCHAPYPVGGRAQRWRGQAITRGAPVIAVSELVRDHLLAAFQVDPELIRVVRPGIDLSLYTPEQVNPTRLIQLARSWSLPDDRPVILVPGRIEPWRGQLELIEALGRLGRRDLCCVMVENGAGEGRPPDRRYRRLLEQRIEALGLAESIRFPEASPDPTAAYMLATMVVSPARDPEGFPRAIIEALAMGRPAVMTDHGLSGRLVEPDLIRMTAPHNIDALAEAVTAVLALSPVERAELAERSIRCARRGFGQERMAEDVTELYRKLSI